MDHDLELISPILEILGNSILQFSHILEILENWFFPFSTILEILEIEVSNIFYNSGNTGGGRPVPDARLRGAWIIFGTSSWKNEHGNFGIKVKTSTFSKWLPRPNHYAHKICIEILSRTPVLKPRYLSSEVPMYMENSEYSSPARMSTWVSSHDCTTGWDTTHDWNARSHDSRPRLVRDP